MIEKRCKATIEQVYPPTQCSRKAKAGCDYCWQHDPKPRHAKKMDAIYRNEWLHELKWARGDVDAARRRVCEAAKTWSLARTGGSRPRGAGDALVAEVLKLKTAEAKVDAMLANGREKGWIND